MTATPIRICSNMPTTLGFPASGSRHPRVESGWNRASPRRPLPPGRGTHHRPRPDPFLSVVLIKLRGVSTFLSLSPYQGVYPSRAWDEFEPETDVLAVADDATPLLWLALFRPADVQAGRLDRDWEDWTQGTRPINAPVVPRRRAFSQLYAAVDVLEPVLGASIAEHAELMREALHWAPGDWVTIEWFAEDDEPQWD